SFVFDPRVVLLVLSSAAPYPAFFIFSVTTTTVIYTLSLHDALPIFRVLHDRDFRNIRVARTILQLSISRLLSSLIRPLRFVSQQDRKSTRLNSSHVSISYAVFCLKKKINKH